MSRLTSQMIADLAVTHIETPFGDWFAKFKYHFPNTAPENQLEALRRFETPGYPAYSNPRFWNAGYGIILTDEDGTDWIVDRRQLVDAFTRLPAPVRKRIMEDGAWDTIDADALFQQATFDEIVYG